MYNYAENLVELQVELSTNCNALCLGCVRTSSDFCSTKSFIPKNQLLSKEVLYEVLKSGRARKLKKLEFCGNIDEPLAYPKFYELLLDIYKINPKLIISIHTNGGVRNEDYFKKLSALLCQFDRRSNFRFSIDGLEDTNSIYRQNTNWNIIIQNLKAACASDLRVIWQFLVFPWNEHQIEEVKKMSIEVGCTELWIRPDRSLASKLDIEKIKNKELVVEDSQSRAKGDLSKIKALPSISEASVSCSFKENGRMFLSWEGKVWPCCFISNVFYENQAKLDYFKETILAKYGDNFNSLYHYKFDEILDHPYLKKELMESWNKNGDEKINWRCREKCGVNKVRASDGKLDDRTHFAHIELKQQIGDVS